MQKLSVTWYPLLIIYLFIYLVLSVTWYPCTRPLQLFFFLYWYFLFQKLLAFLIHVYQFLETLTVRGVSRVNYEIPRLSKLHEDARRCSNDFQQVWCELEMFKMCLDDMPCEVKKNTHDCPRDQSPPRTLSNVHQIYSFIHLDHSLVV